MLTRSFIHLPGIGAVRERGLWEKGYRDWETFRRRYPEGAWKRMALERLEVKRAARDLPRREAWRMFTAFRDRTAYLDIETEGLGEDDGVTCVGLSDGRTVEGYVRGENLDRLGEALERFDLVVTYNGSCFDLPVLARNFPDINFGRLHHVDLRWPLNRLGYRGGLKKVERTLGLTRAGEVEGADGYTAVLLWREHRRGHPRALETLLRYCLEDVVHLKPLLAHVHNRMVEELPVDAPRVEDTAVPEIPYRADRDLVQALVGPSTGSGPFGRLRAYGRRG